MCIILGVLFFALSQEIIIIQLPKPYQYSSTAVIKKEIKLIFWHNGNWHTETQDMIWHSAMHKNIDYLINSWLTLLDSENVMSKKVTVQPVLLTSAHHEAYISFDRNPFTKDMNTFEKWMFIEGIMRTLRENGIPIQQIQFLVHHAPLHDVHLDFSKAWPIQGFLLS
jgi:hypothetical protein